MCEDAHTNLDKSDEICVNERRRRGVRDGLWQALIHGGAVIATRRRHVKGISMRERPLYRLRC